MISKIADISVLDNPSALFGNFDENIKLVEKLSENADPLCVFFKFIFSSMLNIAVNGKTSDYYYKKCFEVGPHIVQFDEL